MSESLIFVSKHHHARKKNSTREMNELPVSKEMVENIVWHPKTATMRSDDGAKFMQRMICSIGVFHHGTCVVQNVPYHAKCHHVKFMFSDGTLRRNTRRNLCGQPVRIFFTPTFTPTQLVYGFESKRRSFCISGNLPHVPVSQNFG